MDSKEIYDSIKELWEEFDSNHGVFVEKGNKAAAGRRGWVANHQRHALREAAV